MSPRLLVAAALVFLTACSGDGPTNGGGGGGGGEQRPGPATTLSVVSGSTQQVPAGEAAPAPLVVRATDSRGRGVPGVPVTFTPAAGSGSVSAGSAVTDAAGQALASWTVGRSPGTQAVTATSGSLAPATFTATVTPNGIIAATVTFADSLVAFRASLLRGFSRDAASPGALSRHAAAARALNLGARRKAPAAPREPDAAGGLVVTFRPEAVGAPAGSGGARLSRQRAEGVAARMRGAVERAAGAGVRLRDVSPVLHAARVEAGPGAEAEAIAALRRDPAVLRVERDSYSYATAGVEPADPFALAQAWHYRMADLPRAWRRTTGSASVLVAVVDDGIRFDHPDVAPNLTRDGYDFVSRLTASTGCMNVDNAGDGDGYDADPTIPMDWNGCTASGAGGHGLHVAGTIGAASNDIGVTGVAWSVRIRPVRVLGTTGNGSNFDIAQGILYAAGLPASDGRGGVVQASSGARIINLSLGGPTDAAVLRDAVAAASSMGSLLVVSAGNANSSVPQYPAAYPEVLTVSAVGPTSQRAGYSSWGAHVDIAAPGGDFGLGDATFGIASTQWDFQAGAPTYGFLHGTSMAAPHVSGAAALLLASDPSLTAAALRARLLDFAVEAGAPGPDPVFGAGILNVRNSLARSRGIQGRLFGRVYDAATGAIVREVMGGANAFSAGGLADGTYHVFAGIDDEGDGIFGTNGFRWGAFTGVGGTLQAVTVSGAGSYPAAFSIGFAREREPNNLATNATRLMLGGSLYAQLGEGDVDVYTVTLPAGSYTFETRGWEGSCGLATDADTEITLRSAAGAVLAVNDDIDFNRLDLCSRASLPLAAGTYTLSVRGFSPGFYRVLVRPA